MAKEATVHPLTLDSKHDSGYSWGLELVTFFTQRQSLVAAWHWFITKLAQWWSLGWILALVPILVWTIDYTPPFHTIQYYRPAPVYAGQEVLFVLDVERDLSRKCDSKIMRYLLSSNGFRSEITTSLVPARGIEQMDRVMDGQLRFKYPVPITTPSGLTHLISTVEYKCKLNPLHAIWPITVYLDWPFEVLPPKE